MSPKPHFKAIRIAIACASAVVAFCGLARADDGKTLHVYNFSQNIAPGTIEKFEKETGIKVTYDVYDSDDTLMTKLLAGRSDYDIVVPSNNYFAKEKDAGIFAKIDLSKLSNLKNLDPQIVELTKANDPKGEYGIPYIWGITGIAYNLTEVKKRAGADAPLDSWDMILDPKWAAKLKSCGLSLQDNGGESFQDALFGAKLNPDSTDPKDFRVALEKLKAIRPFVTQFSSNSYIDDLAGGDICAAVAYSGDAQTAKLQAKAAGRKFELTFVIPKEGAPLWLDMFAIPAESTHKENATKFIDFMLRPDVAAAQTNELKYPTAVSAARPLINPEIANDTAIFPLPKDMKRVVMEKPLPISLMRQINRDFLELKANR
ncbi:extracellular solute-binding protein [Paraburkholderia haematera]|jgi:Spermidine/putrescine-binding periplasmic protein|uniref:Putrescine-binding periplasmic protein n=1 Tax=Paraburkholderia haematera TaxID=2793077 RepID=A0ABM8RQ00_9BURK|nr:extracellular solute-binding protein [Paraburkholderia haematera]CAE6765067.1 Putrescine-binding periplasmic protein SpuD [Paraburkholderia haematera]